MKKHLFILIITISFIYSNGKQTSDALDVFTFTLDNGLTVYINEDHSTTSVFGAETDEITIPESYYNEIDIWEFHCIRAIFICNFDFDGSNNSFFCVKI